MTTIGIIGGGQLARMSALAAHRLGIGVRILDPDPACPAAQVAPNPVVAALDDADGLAELSRSVDVVTLENEFVPAERLAVLEASGATVFPSAATLGLIQDKARQKAALRSAGLAVPDFAEVSSPDDVTRAAESWGWPLVLKSRKNGYDGRGNRTVRSADELPAAWTEMADRDGGLMVERWVPFSRELATLVARRPSGQAVVYPVVETIQRDHICHEVFAPAADLSDAAAHAVRELALAAIEAVDGIGLFGVELFELTDGTVLVNELAPRPHNSGHYSIEGCTTSQFEQHVRAVLDLPLGRTDLLFPAVVMRNLLGSGTGAADPGGLAAALRVPGAHIHLYGKAERRPGRKLGHVTTVSDDPSDARTRARHAADRLGL